MLRWFVAVVVVLGSLAAAPSAVPFQGVWEPIPNDLSLPGGDARSPQVVVAPDGTTTVVWVRFEGTDTIVQASTRPPGGAFAAPIDLSPAAGDATDPQLVVAPDGTTTAIWSLSDGVTSIVQARTRPPGGAFGAPVQVSASDEGAGQPSMAVAPDGTTTAVWSGYDGADTIVRASTRPPGGAFGPPVDVSATGSAGFLAHVATAPDGTTTVAWYSNDGGDFIVRASTRAAAGGAFGAPVDLSTGSFDFFPEVAVAPDGTTTVVWDSADSGYHVIQASTRQPGGAFSAPVGLSTGDTDARGPGVAVAPDGTTTVVWGLSSGADTIVQARTRPAGGAFGVPVDLSAPGGDARAPQVVVVPDGTATVVWQRSDADATMVQARTRPPGDAFGPPVDLSAAGGRAEFPRMAVAPDGSAAAVWERSGGPSTSALGPSTTVQAVGTGIPPRLGAIPRIAGTASVGTTLACDEGSWSGAETVTTSWLRNGIRIAVGLQYAITSADQGSALSCRARAVNPYGSVEALSAPIVIRPAVVPPGPPNARSRPRITGRARLGRVLRCRPATFTDATRRTTSWLRSGGPIRGVHGATYRIARRDLGRVISCRTTATGPGGTSRAISLGVLARARR